MTAPSARDPGKNEAWSVERLEDATFKLKQMHIQLRELRNTIPKMVAPLTKPHNSPDEFFVGFSRSATIAAEEVAAFTRLMRSEPSRTVLEYASASRKMQPNNIRPWMVTEHPDWLDLGSHGGKGPAMEVAEIHLENARYEDDLLDMGYWGLVEKTIQEFRDAHADIQVDLSQSEKAITCILPSPSNLRFIIDQEPLPEQKTTLRLRCNGSSYLTAAIERSVTAQCTAATGLKALLDLATAYTDIKSRRCDKCETWLKGSPPQLPAIRKIRRSRPEEGQSSVVWDALHEECA
ncbi:MAG: hypothetical protein M4579_002750 [Chaenotheca gracillima]|nr:MAG: hypothetical protein M4579_002750 [Chaenotheca gracillima]